MQTTRSNLIAMAGLGTLLAVFGLKELGAAVYRTETPPADKMGMKIEVAEATAEGGGTAEPATAEPLGKLLAAADPAKGEAVAKACAACHDFNKGGPNKVGPNLWGVVGRNHGSVAGFAYSEALAAKSAEPWSYDALYAFVENPKAVVPGTKMGFGGVKSAAKRADLLAYLAKLSDAPVPFPAP